MIDADLFKWLAFSLFIIGVVCGVWLTMLFRDTRREMREKHFKDVTDEMWTEVVRLRAQVATLVGKDT